MLRSIFFSAGLFVTLCGVSLLMIDKVVLTTSGGTEEQSGISAMFASEAEAEGEPKVVDPPEWAAFSLMSVGTVTMLYAVALPRKQG